MNKKTEEKLLREFIKVIDDPEETERKFIKYARIAIFIAVLFLFFCLSNNMNSLESKYVLALLAYVSGTASGLGIWFLQAGTQTGIMARHMSRESIQNRIDEINA